MDDIADHVDYGSVRGIQIPYNKLSVPGTHHDGMDFSFGTSTNSLYSNACSHGTLGSVSSGSLAMYEQESSSTTRGVLMSQSVDKFYSETYDEISRSREGTFYDEGDYDHHYSALDNRPNTIGDIWGDSGSFMEDEREDAVILSAGDPISTDFNYSPTYGTSDTENYFSDLREKRQRTQSRRFVTHGRASTPLIAWNAINMITSISILAMPYAVAKGGLVTLGLITLLGMITLYTGNLVVSCTYSKGIHRRHPNKRVRIRFDFRELGQDSTNSRLGGLVVALLEVTEMLMKCTLNVNVLGALCHEILPSLDIRICTVIGGAIALPTFFVRRLVIIGWMQTISILSLGIGMILVEGYCLARVKDWTVSNLPVCDLTKLPVTAGILLFAFGIHHVLPGIEQQMRKPRHFSLMMFFAQLISVLIFCFFGFTNALLYGQHTDQVITVDLKHHFGLGIASAAFIFISVVCMFALPTLVVMERIDQALSGFCPRLKKGESETHFVVSLVVRIVVVVVSIIFAVFLPCFGLVMAFVGSTTGSFLCLILPCLFHLKIKGDSMTRLAFIVDIFIVILGIFCFATGTFFSCKAMVHYFNITG